MPTRQVLQKTKNLVKHRVQRQRPTVTGSTRTLKKSIDANFVINQFPPFFLCIFLCTNSDGETDRTKMTKKLNLSKDDAALAMLRARQNRHTSGRRRRNSGHTE